MDQIYVMKIIMLWSSFLTEERRPTVNELANQKGASQKASGWKLYHMAAQMEDLVSCLPLHSL